jgi:predicted ATP-grasp superfamily ATP-dependent carboligase
MTPPPANRLLIIGASARAAAFSALRAGLQPWCADLFADADLRRRCPAIRLHGRYPHAFLDVVRNTWRAWMYTGGLENWPRLVGQLAQVRPLWGNDEAVLAQVRDPWKVRDALREVPRIVVPQLAAWEPPEGDPAGRWLVKPVRGAGGSGIYFLEDIDALKGSRRAVFFQEYIEGKSYAVLFTGDGQFAHWHGVTRQLVGEPWLNAAPFHYCGSLGPDFLTETLLDAVEVMGARLVKAFDLRGLFGVDGVVRDNTFYPVEVNPRYTASMEVLEYAQGWPALAFHRAACGAADRRCVWVGGGPYPCVGKAILFAREPLDFPASGPWEGELQHPADLHQVPAFADIPQPGERLEAGRPVLTFFAQARTETACLDTLQQIARVLNGWLFGNPG